MAGGAVDLWGLQADVGLSLGQGGGSGAVIGGQLLQGSCMEGTL